MKKNIDGKWYCDTIEELTTLEIFHRLDKIHKYNEELQRILTNEDDLPQSEVWIDAALFKNKEEIKQTIREYNAFKSFQKPKWPNIILDKSKGGFAVFDDTTHTLV